MTIVSAIVIGLALTATPESYRTAIEKYRRDRIAELTAPNWRIQGIPTG